VSRGFNADHLEHSERKNAGRKNALVVYTPRAQRDGVEDEVEDEDEDEDIEADAPPTIHFEDPVTAATPQRRGQ
jgi:hypothetical protein